MKEERMIYFVVPDTTNGYGGEFKFAYSKTEAERIAKTYVRFGRSAWVYEASSKAKEYPNKERRKTLRKVAHVLKLQKKDTNNA